MTKEEKEKIEKIYGNLLENFPFDKYDDIINNIKSLFSHPSAKKGLMKYIKEELVDKNSV
tara:strand:- start:1240 stop:1419 length:180 start_codon:yes stop_codon:yes gene_type:complete